MWARCWVVKFLYSCIQILCGGPRAAQTSLISLWFQHPPDNKAGWPMSLGTPRPCLHRAIKATVTQKAIRTEQICSILHPESVSLSTTAGVGRCREGVAGGEDPAPC